MNNLCDSVLWQMIVLPVTAIPLYVTSAIKFLKNDLPIWVFK